MLGMQEQARRDRVHTNRQDPAHPRICVPTMVIRGDSYRLKDKLKSGVVKPTTVGT